MVKRENNLLYRYLAIYIVLNILIYPIGLLIDTSSIMVIWNLGIFILLTTICILKIFRNQSVRISVIGIEIGLILIIVQLITFYRSNIIIGHNMYINANINIFISGVCAILIYGFFVNLETSYKNIEAICRIYLICCIISCLYNIIVNFNKILNFTSMTTAYTYSLHSFFGNKNLFGYILLYGIICNTIMYVKSKRNNIKYIAIYLILFFNLILTLSRNSILVSILFITLTFIIKNIKKLNIKKYIIPFILIVLFIRLIKIQQIEGFVNKFIIREAYGLTTRDLLWNVSVESLKLNNGWIWGLGLGQIGSILNNYTYVTSVHNLYLEVILGGGLIKLSIYIFMIIYSLYHSVKIYKIDNDMGSIFISIIIGYFVYGIFESVIILGIGVMSTLCTIFILILPITYHKYLRMRERGNYEDL